MNRNKVTLAGATLLNMALGVILLLTGNQALLPACYVIIVALTAIGILNIVSYLARPVEQNTDSNGFVFGVTAIILSITGLLHVSTMEAIIPFLLALLVTLNGVRELQNAIDAGRLKIRRSWIFVLAALVNTILGIVLMANPFSSEKVHFMTLGLGLIVSSLADFITSLVVAIQIHKASSPQDTVEMGLEKDRDREKTNGEEAENNSPDNGPSDDGSLS